MTYLAANWEETPARTIRDSLEFQSNRHRSRPGSVMILCELLRHIALVRIADTLSVKPLYETKIPSNGFGRYAGFLK